MQKISTICSTFKSAKRIKTLVDSFNSQTYSLKELILVDGSEKKKDYKLMLKNVKKFKNIKVFYLPGSSIYECLNLGINKSSGTIINIMGDDDQFYNKDIFRNIFKKISSGIDYIYGDTIYQKNGKKIRYYKSFEMKKNLMTIAYMPSHTSLFLKKNIYNTLGNYNINYKIASDLEFFFRLYNNKRYKYKYIKQVITIMSDGGTSNKSIKNILKSNIEVYKILNENKYNFILVRIIIKLALKYLMLLNFSTKKYE
jgi:glycosyltransferase involved in cell wall biosynthesis